MNETNAVGVGVGNRLNFCRGSGNLDGSRVWLVHSPEDVHQRGFSGTVFTDDSNNLPLSDLKVDIAQRVDAWEKLVD